MTEEKREQCNCICQTEAFKKIVVIAVGSFVGVFSALALFTALHKPPMLQMPPCPMMRPPFEQQGHFKKAPMGEFHKEMVPPNLDQPVKRPQ